MDPDLTKNIKTNWDHEGEMAIDEFIEFGLIVYFSDPVSPAGTHEGRGWFVVQVEYPNVDLGTIIVQNVLPEAVGMDPADPTQAIFKPTNKFGPTFVDMIKSKGIDPNILCRVVLKCDYLAGTQEKVVDGDFLGCRFPTGDGVPGGDFESWFKLVLKP